MKPMIVIMLLVMIIGLSLLINRKFARQDKRYDELVNTYECSRWPCFADFNRNGTSDRVDVIPINPSYRLEQLLVVMDGEHELFRHPYIGIDGTLRTHSAIRSESDGVLLLIFDGTNGPGKHVNAAYRWNGERMLEVPQSELDKQILLAMAARDDSGSWHQWVLYRLVRDAYFSLLTIGAIIVVLFFGIRSLIRT